MDLRGNLVDLARADVTRDSEDAYHQATLCCHFDAAAIVEQDMRTMETPLRIIHHCFFVSVASNRTCSQISCFVLLSIRGEIFFC